MSVKKFKFVSPGVFLSEVDNSQLPADVTELGPCILGRTEFGPAMRPVTVQSFSEFVERRKQTGTNLCSICSTGIFKSRRRTNNYG